MSRLLSFQAGVERAVKTQRMTTTYTSDLTRYSANTERVVADILIAVEAGKRGEDNREREEKEKQGRGRRLMG